MALRKVSDTGSRLEQLRELRNILAVNIDSAEPNAVAALSARYVQVIELIESLAPAAPVERTGLDELEARRDARGADTKTAARPAKRAARGR